MLGCDRSKDDHIETTFYNDIVIDTGLIFGPLSVVIIFDRYMALTDSGNSVVKVIRRHHSRT